MSNFLEQLVAVPNTIQNALAFIATDPLPWKEMVIGFSWVEWALETGLLLRQYPNYSKSAPPAVLAPHFKDDKFEKSQRYGKDKAKFALISRLYNQIFETGFIWFASQPWAWDTAGAALVKFGYPGEHEIVQSILYSAILYFASSIPSLPVSLYQTFVLEEKHGFNKSTLGLFFVDMVKGWGLGFAFGAPLLAGFLKIVKWAGDSFVPYLMTFLISFQLIMVVVYPLVIQPLFNKLSPLPEGTLRTRVEALAKHLEFPLTHLYVIDGSKRSSHSNAYFYGLPWSKHIVIYDTLIKQTPEEEIEAVLAHELGHWKYSHPFKLLIISQIHLYTILSLFPPFLRSAPLLRSFGFAPRVAAKPPIIVAFMLFQMILSPIESLFKLFLNGMSRGFEYQADQFACELDERQISAFSGEDEKAKGTMSERLGRALIGLHVENLSTVWVDSMYSAYHHSHPTLTERLKAMDEYKQKRSPRDKKDL